MFSFGNFIKRGLLDAVGKMADYQIILNAAGWHEKGVLTEDDLSEIQTAIEANDPQPQEPEEPQPEDETVVDEVEEV